MEERIKAIKKYLEYFPSDRTARDNLLLYEYANELGMDIRQKSWWAYPKINCGYFVINEQIKVGKKHILTNSATKYKQNEKDSIVIWGSSCGRLDFVRDEYWYDVQDEWDEFISIIKSYNPLDYDNMNQDYIFDLENGKKLIDDYDKILGDFKDKLDRKIKAVKLEKKKKQLEKLQRELEESV